MGIKKKIKKIYKEHLINKNFGQFKTKITIKKDWDKINFNRISLISSGVSNILKHKKYCNYLEIGCDDNFVFNSIGLPIKFKTGVDPSKGGNYKIKSDDFFKINKKKFDVIFIDGLHHYDQCQRDVINALNCLHKNGFLFIHDLLPLDWRMELVPRIQGRWNGDVWKVGLELAKSKELKFFIADMDSGVGFLQKTKDRFTYTKIDSLKNLRFIDYLKIYKQLPIIKAEKALNKIVNG
tara:strand:- start:2135 stop:2845 length:711 start_codon:yes stop_codon:yes gene_type:complete